MDTLKEMRNRIVKFSIDLVLQVNLKIHDVRKRSFFEFFCVNWPQIEATMKCKVFFENVIYFWE